MNSERLALGTVQFGIDYGVTNSQGKVSFAEVVKILRLAHEGGLQILDSAATYGAAQEVIGKALREENLCEHFSVVTKVHLAKSHDLKGQLKRQIEQTLQELRGVPLHSVMIHHGYQLVDFAGELPKLLVEAQKEYGLSKLGASFYRVGEYEQAAQEMRLDVVQVPFNVFNQSFEAAFQNKAQRPEVHVRSIFLQGVLLAEPVTRPKYFARFKEELSEYDRTVAASELSPLEYNLNVARSQKWIDRIVVGVTTAEELRAILMARSKDSILPSGHLNNTNESLTDPSKWDRT